MALWQYTLVRAPGVLEREKQPSPWRQPNLAQYFNAHGIDPAHHLSLIRGDRGNSDAITAK